MIKKKYGRFKPVNEIPTQTMYQFLLCKIWNVHDGDNGYMATGHGFNILH
jgi:hypothetical protein